MGRHLGGGEGLIGRSLCSRAGSVTMGGVSNEFKPGHPVVFWTLIVVAVFLAATFVRMGLTADGACAKGEKKQWIVTEFDWKCGDSGIALTDE